MYTKLQLCVYIYTHIYIHIYIYVHRSMTLLLNCLLHLVGTSAELLFNGGKVQGSVVAPSISGTSPSNRICVASALGQKNQNRVLGLFRRPKFFMTGVIPSTAMNPKGPGTIAVHTCIMEPKVLT